MSSTLTLSIVYIGITLIKKRNSNKQNLISVKKNIEQYSQAFWLLPKKDRLNLITTILSKDHSLDVVNDCVVYKLDNLSIAITIIDRPINSNIELTSALSEVYSFRPNIIKMICPQISSVVKIDILFNTKVEIIDNTRLFSDFFLKYQIYPDASSIKPQDERIKLKDILKGIVDTHKTKGYFFAGLVLMLSSLFIPYKTYYIISGTLFLILALMSKLLPIISKHKSQ